MSILDLLLVALATFYVAYAISSTHGPWNVFGWLKGHMSLGGLTACLVCLSPWFATLFYVLQQTPFAWIVSLFAVSGASVFLWRYTGGANL